MDVSRPHRDPSDSDDVGRLTELLLSTGSFDTFLNELVAHARSATRHSCSITVRNRSSRAPYTVAATDELTTRLDERQYGEGRGPCLEALATGVPVLVTDMAAETRWAPYPEQAAALGARSSMSYPLAAGKQPIGALNLYAFEPLVPDAALQARVAQLADRAAGALAVGLRIAEEQTKNPDLRAALNSRSIIDQAVGILIAQQQCSVEDAFALLRRTSQGRNVKLRDAATQIVASAQRRGPGRPGGRY